ncbi:MAG: DnaJ domain-containing protein [Deltaproteobacteria bacterium]|nr:DnaJ domain-containing protein [Deltaproteobacteria bacterium]
MRLPTPDSVPRPTGDLGALADLDATSRVVLSSVNGSLSVSGIADVCGMEISAVQKIVASLAGSLLVAVPGFDPTRAEASRLPCAPVNDAALDALATEVDAFHADLPGKNFYDLLGVDVDADRKQMRHAYFELSKKFHPDRAFGKLVPELRKKMEVIFRRVTQAYDTLAKPETRAEYDAYIKDQIEIRMVEKRLQAAISPEKAAAPDAAPKAPQAKHILPVRPKAAPRPKPAAAKAAPRTVQQPAQESSPEHELRRKRWQKERAGRALAAVLKSSNAPPHVTRAASLVEAAILAVDTKRYTEAIQLINEALQLNPSNAQAKDLLEVAKAGTMRSVAQDHVRQGMFERRRGQMELARDAFEKAVKADPENIDARHQLAEVLVELKQDLTRAYNLAREVIGMGGQRARYFVTLGEILLLAKDAARAREAFGRALALEPDNKELRKKLKSLGA